ncbi:MAG: HAMP domain-containing histidine kinase [Comamonadaceae bacterium]|nr:MAG: HAMP domain-containing histidine kinase [Comamonadaceae bacterium]
MRLADFIDQETTAIVDNAERFAATLLPAAARLEAEGLRDHIPMILAAVALDLRAPQSAEEQHEKSLGNAPRVHGAPETAAQTHALLRAKGGFDIEQIVAEYRVLRATVLRLWMASPGFEATESADDLIRFNEAIDQAVAESVAFFTAEVDRWRHVFLGVLGHDLRGPLNAILLTAEMLSRLSQSAPVTRHTEGLIRSGKRMKDLLDDLLDFSRASLGVGVDVHRAEVDLAAECLDEVEVLRAALPDCEIEFSAHGDGTGHVDASRVREVLANLVSNASRYRTEGSAVRVSLDRDGDAFRLRVENQGEPIASEVIADLFEPLRRGNSQPNELLTSRANLGLGLFIAREIATAHGGEVTAKSVDGRTAFTMTFPAR